jgi:mRNA interferase MazF
MPTFEPGVVVRVPFPCTDRPVRQYRPALVVATPGGADVASLLWVLMITSARNRPWPDDVEIAARDSGAGLPVPSVVRTRKIATIDAQHAEPIGRIDATTLGRVRATLKDYLRF